MSQLTPAAQSAPDPSAVHTPGGRPVPVLTEWVADAVWRFRGGLLAFVVGLYALGFNGAWRVEPDAALYLTLGRNLATGHGYTYLWQPHRLAYPGLPWLVAGTFRVFGVNVVWPVHVLMLLITLGTLGLVYRLFLLHAGPRTALVVTLGVGVTKTFYRYAYEVRSDMPFLLGTMAFLCGYEAVLHRHPPVDAGGTRPRRRRRWFDWALLVGGVAVAAVMRPTIWVLLLATAVAVVWSAARGHLRLRTVLGLLAAVVLLVVAFRALDPRRVGTAADDYEATAITAFTTNLRATAHTVVHENLPELMARAAPDALMQVRLGPVNGLIGVTFIVMGLWLVRAHVLWGVLVALIVLTSLLILPLDRYFLPVLPLLTYAWWAGLRRLNAKLPNRLGGGLVVGLLFLGLGSNLAKDGGIVIEQRWVPFLAHYAGGSYVPLSRMAGRIHALVGDDGVVLITHPDGRIMTFLGSRAVVDRRDFLDPGLSAHPVYVVTPFDADTADLLRRWRLSLGPVIAAVPDGPSTTWELHTTVPAAGP